MLVAGYANKETSIFYSFLKITILENAMVCRYRSLLRYAQAMRQSERQTFIKIFNITVLKYIFCSMFLVSFRYARNAPNATRRDARA